MEGIYRSDDGGESWQITGEGLVHNRVFALAIDPKNSNKLYAGTLYGLHLSTNGGRSYQFVPQSTRTSIAAIAVDPFDSAHIIAAEGWTDDDDADDLFHNLGAGRGKIFVSRDGGTHWEERFFDEDARSSPNVHSVAFDPVRHGALYLGGSKGVFLSRDGGSRFERVAAPPGTTANRGLALSPDGEVIYAVFATGEKQESAVVFAAATRDMAWSAVKGGLPAGLRYWRPVLDSRSAVRTHRVLVALQNERAGLFEGRFEWQGGKLVSQEWKNVFLGTEGYDVGWDFAAPNPRFAHYTPVGWPRAVWTTANQNAFVGTPEAKSASAYAWQNRYCREQPGPRVWDKFSTYSSRGWASTFTYDFAVHGNYVLQGQGDNGWVESWDAGRSWCSIQRHQQTDDGPVSVSDAQSVAVADAWGTPVVLAHGAMGFGGNTSEGWLFAKKLKTHSPADAWEFIGAGPKWKGGLPFGVIRDIAVAPSKPRLVYFAVAGHGIYRNDDIGWYVEHINTDGQAGVECISSASAEAARSARQLCVHPKILEIVYFTCVSGPRGLYRGERLADKTWQWKRVHAGGGWNARVACWEVGGKVRLLYASQDVSQDVSHGTAEKHSTLSMSSDDGQTWKVVLSKDQVQSLRPSPTWLDHLAGDYRFVASGLAAQGSEIVVAFYDHRFQKGYGVFRGRPGSGESIDWQDWTADLPFPGFTDTAFVEAAGRTFFYGATPGMGLWRRAVNSQ
jgi:hypothetical protein